MNLKPFDLEAALRGEPVVTRDGRAIIDMVLFKNKKIICSLAGSIEDYYAIVQWDTNGRFDETVDNKFDLFMGKKTKKLYIGIALSPKDGAHWTTGAYESEEQLMDNVGMIPDRMRITEIEIEV